MAENSRRSRRMTCALVVVLVLVAAPAGDLDDDVDGLGSGWHRPSIAEAPDGARPSNAGAVGGGHGSNVWRMEFRRITNLPPYVFTIIDGLKIEARRAGEDVIDLGFGNPDLPSPDDRRREALRGGAQQPQPPLLVQPGHPEAARGGRRPLPAALRRRPRPRDRGHQRRSAPRRASRHLMWVLLAARATPRWCRRRRTRSTSGARCSPAPTSARSRWAPTTDFFENVQRGLRVLLAQAAGDRAVVPAQPDHHLRRPGVHAAGRRLRPRERRRRRARQRLRRARLRRLRAAVDPAGRGRQGVRGRAVLDDQVVLDGRLARWRSWSATPRSSPRSPSSRATSTTARSSRSRSPPPSRSTRTPDHPREVLPIYQARRDALCDGLNRIGWEIDAAEGHDVRVGADPRAVPGDGLGRVRVVPGPRGQRGHVAGRRLRPRRRRPRALRRSSRTSSASPRPSATCARHW